MNSEKKFLELNESQTDLENLQELLDAVISGNQWKGKITILSTPNEKSSKMKTAEKNQKKLDELYKRRKKLQEELDKIDAEIDPIYWTLDKQTTTEEKFIELKKLYDQSYSIDGGEESQSIEKQKGENFTRIDSIFNSLTPEEKIEWANRH